LHQSKRGKRNRPQKGQEGGKGNKIKEFPPERVARSRSSRREVKENFQGQSKEEKGGAAPNLKQGTTRSLEKNSAEDSSDPWCEGKKREGKNCFRTNPGKRRNVKNGTTYWKVVNYLKGNTCGEGGPTRPRTLEALTVFFEKIV